MTDPGEVVVPIRADVDVVVARQKIRGLVSDLRFSGSELTRPQYRKWPAISFRMQETGRSSCGSFSEGSGAE